VQAHAHAQEIRLVNLMTGFAMVCALTAIVASEVVWKAQLKQITAERVDVSVQTAFIVRTALREGAALMGCAGVPDRRAERDLARLPGLLDPPGARGALPRLPGPALAQRGEPAGRS
jgi:hypothetical protein